MKEKFYVTIDLTVTPNQLKGIVAFLQMRKIEFTIGESWPCLEEKTT